MKLLAFIPIRLTLLLILGIVLGDFFDFSPFPLLVCTLSLFGLLTLYFVFSHKRTDFLFGLIAGLTTVALGTFCYAQAQPIHQDHHFSHINTNKTNLWNVKIMEVLKPNRYSDRYIAAVQRLNSETVSGKLLLSVPVDTTTSSHLNVDDEIQFFGEAKNITSPLNPHQFDYKAYMSGLGIYQQLRLDSGHWTQKRNPYKTVFGIAATARNHILTQLRKADFGKDELSIIQALLLGQRDDISEETYSNYQKAGAVHILAVSGLHIGILLMLLQFVLSPLKYLPKGKTIILVFSVLLLWGFAFLAGFSASIIRATTMFTFVAYALYLNRPSNTFNILALSILFILLFINPNLLFQVGFQMSYAAVFAILWVYPLLKKLWYPKNKVFRYLWQLLSVSIAAQIGVLPISLFYFHQFPGLFFISNLVIVPALGILLGLGILIIILSLINWLPEQLVRVYDTLISWMNNIVAWVAQQERFVFTDISFDAGQLVLSFAVITSLIWSLSNRSFKSISLFLMSVICFQSWTIFQEYKSDRKREVWVMHQTKNSVLFHRNGKNLSVSTADRLNSSNVIDNFSIGERINNVQFDSLRNGYTVADSPFVRIDSTGIYSTGNNRSIILLTQSPKINLERLIATMEPMEIIADGSNYSSYVKRWQMTCLKHKIPFHFTGEKGAYVFQTKN